MTGHDTFTVKTSWDLSIGVKYLRKDFSDSRPWHSIRGGLRLLVLHNAADWSSGCVVKLILNFAPVPYKKTSARVTTKVYLLTCIYRNTNHCLSSSSPQPQPQTPPPPPSSVIASCVSPFDSCYRCYRTRSLRRLGSSLKFLLPFHSQFQVFIGIPSKLILSNCSLRLLCFYCTNSITCGIHDVLVTSVCRRVHKIAKGDY